MIAGMTTLVLTVIGDDRAGLVQTLSEVIAKHHGNWTTSQMAELAGKFAGIVLVDVDEAHTAALTAALEPLRGMLDITVQEGRAADPASSNRLEVEIVGADRPGIVREITEVIARVGGSIETLTSSVSEAPMAGGMLFTARATVRLDGDAADLREQLEALADELMVEFTFDA